MRGRIFRNAVMLAVFAIGILGWQVGEATLWYLSPAYPNENGKGFARDLLGESGGESAVTVSKIADQWKQVPPDEKGYVDLLRRFEATDDKVVYAVATFGAERSGIAEWRFGSDDGIKVWVNGKLAYSLAARRGAEKDSDECFSALAAGENTVVLKVDNGTGAWGFYFRLAEVFPQEKGRHGLIASLTIPPYLLCGSQYPIDQWASARVLNNGTESLHGAVLELRTGDAVIGRAVLDGVAPLSSAERRLRVKTRPLTMSGGRRERVKPHLAAGKARVFVAEEEIAPAKSFTVQVREVHPFLTGDIRDEDGILRFVHATDTHVIADDTVLSNVRTGDNLKAAIRAMNTIGPPPDFVMVTGDLTLDSVPGLDYFGELMKSVRVPWLMIPGNHDKPGGEAVLLPLFGRHGLPLYYSFDYAGYHLVSLDGQPPSGSPVDGGLIPEQIEWLKRDLRLAKGMETLVFVHQHPLLTRIREEERLQGLVDWPELVAVLESFPQVKWVFCGHAHVDYFARQGGIRYIMTTATAYQFSPKDVPYFANEAGVRLMEFEKGKVHSRFLRIDGTWREDPSIEECPEFSPPEEK